MTETNPEYGGFIAVKTFDGRKLFADGEDGVTDRNSQDLNKEDCTCPLSAWKFDTEEFSKYFYSKYLPESNVSS